jgi:hypothetical protein
MPFIPYLYLLLFTKLSLSKINAIKLLTSLLLKLWKVITLHKKEYMTLYNLVTDNFKEYDFETEYCLNIYISRLHCAFSNKKNIEYW